MAFEVTVNGVLAGIVPGAVNETPFTLMSDVAVMLVLAPPLALSLPEFGSLTCNWSAAIVALAEKLWVEGLVQVTDQVAGLAGTVVANDAGSDVFCTVSGFADEVAVPGMLSVNVVSASVGP
jgi:hypothetical protein